MTTAYLIDTETNTIVNACDFDGPTPTPPPWTPAPRYRYDTSPPIHLLEQYPYWRSRP